MSENEMGYRGSKSLLFSNKSVKEQRADGNYFTKLVKIRCALMDCENSYQVRFLSKQLKLNKLFLFLTGCYRKTLSINPYFVTGFAFFDAESSFQISVTINKNSRLG